MDGPWRCIDGGCMGGEDCSVPRLVATEAHALAVMQSAVEVENAWCEALGLPVKTPTLDDAERVVRRYRLDEVGP